MTSVRGPSVGYGTDIKEEWRDWVYCRVGGYAPGADTASTGNVLLMPSLEGHEIEHLLRRGFSQDQLYIVDESPAVVATLKRRFHGVHTFGVQVHRACEIIAKSGVNLLAANIDYCSKVSAPVMRSVAMACESGALDGAHLFVNVLRGREDAAERRMIASAGVPDENLERFLQPEAISERAWWETLSGLAPTKLDIQRIIFLHRVAARSWAQACAYTSPNGQSFLTVWMQPQRQAQVDAIGEIVASLPGESFGGKYQGWSYAQFRRGAWPDHRARLTAISRNCGLSERTLWARMQLAEAA
jgi:hypothetical protein